MGVIQMILCEYPWWPRSWLVTGTDENVDTRQVSACGIFETCGVLNEDLLIEVNCEGRIVVGRVGHSLIAPNLVGLRDFLLRHSGESMTIIENLDVHIAQFNTGISGKRAIQ
jgi:hypothetical protein